MTCAGPSDFLEVLDWQWNERVIPYWTEEASFAREQGIVVVFEEAGGHVVGLTLETLVDSRARSCAGGLSQIVSRVMLFLG